MLRNIGILLLTTICWLPALAQTDDVGAGRALVFDGVDDYVELQSNYSTQSLYASISFPLTFTTWINPSSSSKMPLFSSNDNNGTSRGFWLMISGSEVWFEYGDGKGGQDPAYRQGIRGLAAKPFVNKWTHIAVVMASPVDLRLYVNGVSVGASATVGTSTSPMQAPDPTDKAKIGYSIINNIKSFFQGQMDEVTIWSKALSEVQVRDYMCGKKFGTEDRIIGHWNFNEISGATAYDVVKKTNNGVLKGNPTHVYSGAPIGDQSGAVYKIANSYSQNISFGTTDGTFEVDAYHPNIIGVHIYLVSNFPSRKDGLPAQINQSYYGMFIVANHEFIAPTPILYYNGIIVCDAHWRVSNSTPSWDVAPRPLSVAGNQMEVIATNPVIYQGPVVSLGPDKEFCDVPSYRIETGFGATGNTFLWSTGAKTPTIDVDKTGTYWVKVSNVCGTATDTVRVKMASTPLPFSLGADAEYCRMPLKLINAIEQPNGVSFTWQDGSHNSSLEVAKFGTYSAEATSHCGTIRDSVTFKTIGVQEPVIPNVITPNGDSYNESFVVPVRQDLSFSLFVINRWGERVFTSPNYKNDWDGGNLAAGNYFYVLEGDCVQKTKGNLTIIR